MVKQLFKTRYWLSVLLILAFIVRLYGFTHPVADWHSWRQADTSAVSRNFIKFGFDLLHPKFDDLSKTPSNGHDNPEGYRFVEFPIYNVLQAGTFKVFGVLTIEEWGRMISILSSLLSIIIVYLLAKKYANERVAFFASFFLAFLPYNIYYSRTILPDITMVTFFLATIYVFDKWMTQYKGRLTNSNSVILYIVLLVLGAGSLLLKPFAAFFLLPLLWIAWIYGGKSFFKLPSLWILAVLSVIPLILWRIWMLQYPGGIPINNWLFNGNHIRFKGAFLQWIFADRIPRLILGYWGLPLVFLGLITKKFAKGEMLFYTFILSSLIYLFTVATGNVQHDYYQIPIIPSLALLFGKGMDALLDTKLFYKPMATGLAFVSTVLMLILGWYIVRDYWAIEHPELVAAGHVVDMIAPKDAKVIADYGGDTTFLYQTNRQGWPVVDRSFTDLIKAGAAYIAFSYPTTGQTALAKRFPIVAQGPTTKKGVSFLILDLRHPLPNAFKHFQ